MILPAGGRSYLQCARGATLLELMTALAIATFVIGSLYLLLAVGIKGRLIIEARISEQEHGRRVLAWITDRLRQAGYEPDGLCPEGLVHIGSGKGFDQRLAFRAVVDERLDAPRRVHIYYLEDRTLWQETRAEDAGAPCFAEAERDRPDPQRVALLRGMVRTFELDFLDKNSTSTAIAASARGVRITLGLEMEASPDRIESQTYQTTVAIRGP